MKTVAYSKAGSLSVAVHSTRTVSVAGARPEAQRASAPRRGAAAGGSALTAARVSTRFASSDLSLRNRNARARTHYRLNSQHSESTYIMVKPDGVQRGLVGEVIRRFERKGYALTGLKMCVCDKLRAEEHYKELAGKPFFPKLVDYICSGPVVCMVWEGTDVVKAGRKIIGATNPTEAEAGTIRGDFGVEVGRNIVHGSDSVENGEREISLWFGANTGGEGVVEWEPTMTPWIKEY